MRTVVQHARYDLMLIYREAMPVGPPIVESLLATAKVPLVYDFDDAVFLPNTSEANRWIGALKQPQKTAAIIRRCDQVIAGNDYLAAYARRIIVARVCRNCRGDQAGIPARLQARCTATR